MLDLHCGAVPARKVALIMETSVYRTSNNHGKPMGKSLDIIAACVKVIDKLALFPRICISVCLRCSCSVLTLNLVCLSLKRCCCTLDHGL